MKHISGKPVNIFFVFLMFVGIFFFCTDPIEPDFTEPPVIGNNKQVLTQANPILGQLF